MLASCVVPVPVVSVPGTAEVVDAALRRSSSSRYSNLLTRSSSYSALSSPEVVDAGSCVVPVPVVSVPGSAEVVDAASCVVPVPVVAVPGSPEVVDAGTCVVPVPVVSVPGSQKW